MRSLLLLVLLVSAPAFAQVSDDLAAAYIEASALNAPIEAIASELTSQIAAQSQQFPDTARAAFLSIYADAFSPEVLGEHLQTYIAREAVPDSLRDVLTWYESPLAQRMQALELDASDDAQSQAAVQAYAVTGALGSDPVRPEREALLDRYFAVNGGAEAFVDLYVEIIVASALAMSEVALEPPPPADSIRAVTRPQLAPMFGVMVRGGLLYAYRDVADEDLAAYISLMEDPAAQYANRLGRGAMQDVLVGAVTEAGEGFAQELIRLDEAGAIDLEELQTQQAGQGG